jgi:predicted ATPase
MKYGLFLCSNTLDDGAENNSGLFFTSVNQINKGGPDAIHNPNHRSKLAVQNLKAGELSISLSDITTAFKFFEHGISYLGEDRWTERYELSLGLYDAAAEAASALGKNDSVTYYTNKVVKNAHSVDDRLHCKCLLYPLCDFFATLPIVTANL